MTAAHVEPGWLLPRIVAAARTAGAFGVCGVRDVYRGAAGPPCRRTSPVITWAMDPAFAIPGLTRDRCRQLVAEAIGEWARVADVRPREVVDPTTASIALRSHRIDGPFGVLAMCGLPCGVPDSMPMSLDVDSGEASWSEAEFRACMCHEIGHGLGLDHAPAGSPNLMAPVLNLAYGVPQPGYDVPQIRARYGPPAAGPAPGPPPGPAPGPTPGPAPGPAPDAARVVLVAGDGRTLTVDGRVRPGNPTAPGYPRAVFWLPGLPYKLTLDGEPRQSPL